MQKCYLKVLVSAILLAALVLINGNCLSVVDSGQQTSSDQVSQPAISYEYSIPIDANWKLSEINRGLDRSPMTIPEIVKSISKSVVAVHTEATEYDIFLQPVPAQGVGTGIIIDKKGYILTNNHVVENARTIKVIMSDGKSVDALKVNRDTWTDLAVIQLPPDGLSAVEIGSSNDLLVGEGVVAVGNALALEGGPTVTSGIVSYLGRSIIVGSDVVLHDLIQTDAAINPGNSGGPLLNMQGKVVGINSAVAAGGQNIGFAIAVTPALPIIEQLIRQGYVVRPWLGIQLYSINGGVLVIGIDKGSPAEKAGMLPGDIVTSYNGKQNLTAPDLREMINSSQVGQSVEIKFVRKNRQMSVTITLEKSPPK
jgi:serine protease Do